MFIENNLKLTPNWEKNVWYILHLLKTTYLCPAHTVAKIIVIIINIYFKKMYILSLNSHKNKILWTKIIKFEGNKIKKKGGITKLNDK